MGCCRHQPLLLLLTQPRLLPCPSHTPSCPTQSTCLSLRLLHSLIRLLTVPFCCPHSPHLFSPLCPHSASEQSESTLHSGRAHIPEPQGGGGLPQCHQRTCALTRATTPLLIILTATSLFTFTTSPPLVLTASPALIRIRLRILTHAILPSLLLQPLALPATFSPSVAPTPAVSPSLIPLGPAVCASALPLLFLTASHRHSPVQRFRIIYKSA
ncbi:unnamed protein product [Closterium sp. NIES-54]